MKRTKYVICATYDTETCNIGHGNQTRAYPILFIDNDLRDKDMRYYEPDKDDKVTFYRHEHEYIGKLEQYIAWGEVIGKVPIVCAYNLMFDLQPIIWLLNNEYKITANAQSSTNAYTVDLVDEDTDRTVLRFWDTFHLEMRGLKAMGETCGLGKASGDWDYSLIRTPETPLTDLELYYAKRDVQVIPAYLRYLLHANEWMKSEELGSRVLTKTSIVRQMARHDIAPICIGKKNGKKLHMDKAFNELCMAQLPKTYDSYAVRKGCFRGGFTFTAARYANVVLRNVASLDVTSMHHTFINGRYIPLDFNMASPEQLEVAFRHITSKTRQQVLDNYAKPFDYAFHARIQFTNVRLRKGTCFDYWGIALESSAKFKKVLMPGSDIGNDPRNAVQETATRMEGWHDSYVNATFALGKLYEADSVTMHLNEVELWCFNQVYEYDSHKVIFGEMSMNWKLPPDYVTMQSNILFETKNAAKFINNHYEEGKPYEYDIPQTIPQGIAEMLRKGTCSHQFFEAYYTSTVKGMFNGIYGTQAQDVYKPSYKCEGGELVIDKTTVTTRDNWEERQPKSCKVLYTYGMRIVAGSRMHLVIAMELLHEALGSKVRVCGGDTDSMKVSCDDDVSDDMLTAALEPIAKAAREAIGKCMSRLREQHPDKASKLTGIGSFDVEGAGSGTRWDYHMEAWNKARVSESGGRSHITCAGLSRPDGAFTIEDFIDALLAAGYDVERVFRNVLGYNVTVTNPISHSLEGYHPKAEAVYDGEVTDYLGNKAHVVSHESCALYESDRVIGETEKPTNAMSVRYLQEKYKRDVPTSVRSLQVAMRDGAVTECYVQEHTEYGFEKTMRGRVTKIG